MFLNGGKGRFSTDLVRERDLRWDVSVDTAEDRLQLTSGQNYLSGRENYQFSSPNSGY